MNRAFFAICLVLVCLSVFHIAAINAALQQPVKPLATIVRDDMDLFVSTLMSQMTLQEKLGQLNQEAISDGIVTGSTLQSGVDAKIKAGLVGSTFGIIGATNLGNLQKIAVEQSRLGIPLLFALDVIHGHASVWPIPLGVAASWDIELIEQSAKNARAETLLDGVRLVFSPDVDISRDPRWGRVAETSGECPFLGSAIAHAMVKGYQGEDYLSEEGGVAACVKHFALYGAAEAGRDYNTVDMSLNRMFNDYFPAYKAAVDAGVETVMASFNTINGIPATMNKWLLTDVLRTKWGFKGFVMSDYTGIMELINHRVGKNLEDVSIKSLQAGLDMDMVSEGLLNLDKAIEKGLLPIELVDQACRRVLELKYRMGLFHDPYRYLTPDTTDVATTTPTTTPDCDKPNTFADSPVANTDLELDLDLDNSNFIQQYSRKQSLLQQIRAGSNGFGASRLKPRFREFARKIASKSFVLLRNYKEVLPINPKAVKTGSKLAVLGPLATSKRNNLGTWSVGGDPYLSISVLDAFNEVYNKENVVFAKGCNISDDPVFAAKVNVFGNGDEIYIEPDMTSAELLAQAIEVASSEDVKTIVVVLGEAADMSGESSSRSNIDLPLSQQTLLKALRSNAATKDKPIVAILFNGRPLTLMWESENIDAILMVWSGGTESGHAIADVISGVVPPSGKLPMTFPRNVGQIPIYYSQKPTGRPLVNPLDTKFKSDYLDVPNEPLYPFGYGLTYSEIVYSDLKTSNDHPVGDDAVVQVSITIENKGVYDAEEVVQLYIEDKVASLSRSLIDLRGFKKVPVKAGEKKEVSFDVSSELLKFYDNNLEHVWEEGEFAFHVGPSSNNTMAVKVQWDKQ